ncbi:MAG: porin family protein [Nitrospira sp.]|nr:porin family protein [Nitrospira sp.]
MNGLSWKPWFGGMLLGCVMSLLSPTVPTVSAEGVGSFGGIEPKTWVLGARAGFSVPTQTLSNTFNVPISSDIGPLVNFQAMYSFNNWLLAGMMIEWERHGVDFDFGFNAVDLGHQDTVSVLPTVEIRPVKLGQFVPYANMSFGVNVNSFGESVPAVISPSNTFAWRIGWGADFMLNNHIALNAEWAYKRNDGHAHIDRNRVNDWNASSFGFLFGVKAFFN